MNHSESVCTVLLQKLVSDSISGDMFRPRGLPSASLLFFVKGDFCWDIFGGVPEFARISQGGGTSNPVQALRATVS